VAVVVIVVVMVVAVVPSTQVVPVSGRRLDGVGMLLFRFDEGVMSERPGRDTRGVVDG